MPISSAANRQKIGFLRGFRNLCARPGIERAQAPRPPVQVPALAVLLACYIAYLAFRENSFAAPVVKIQKERAQTVITTGPYRYVRHPMYAGMIFYLLGAPLLFGSWWGLLWGLALLGLFAIRILIEERTLKKELQGYSEYTVRVRYRLIPLVW